MLQLTGCGAGRVAARAGAPALAARLQASPGVVSHGLCAPELTADVLIERGEQVEHRRVKQA